MRVWRIKHKLLKDKKKREAFLRLEKLVRILKVFSPRANHLISSSTIHLASRQLHLLGRSASQTRIRNRCLITGRPRGVLKRYGLSRLAFKRLAHLGNISGIKKSSW